MVQQSEKTENQLTKYGGSQIEVFISKLRVELINYSGTKAIHASLKISKDGYGSYIGRSGEEAARIHQEPLKNLRRRETTKQDRKRRFWIKIVERLSKFKPNISFSVFGK